MNLSFKKTGINYQESASRNIANFRADSKAYFKKIKDPTKPFDIRIMVKAQYMSIPSPFVIPASNNIDNFGYHHELMQYFASDPDFRVIFNLLAGPMTQDSFNLMRQSVLQYAQLLKDSNIDIELSIGNELADTYGIQYGISSCTRSGTVATIIPTGAPFLTHVGDTITLWGMNPSAWNGTYTVTGFTPDRTFTITVPNTLSASATGSVYSMSVPVLNAALRQLATDIKAVNPNQKVSCGEYGRTVNGVNNLDDWVANGIGGLDYLSMHIYPGVAGRPGYIPPLPTPEKNVLIALGSSKTYVSEFNLASSTFSTLKQEAQINGMRRMMREFDALGVQRIVPWSWDTNLSVQSNFQSPSATWAPGWGTLLSNNGRIPLYILGQSRGVVSNRVSANRSTTNVRASRPVI